jgi:hypothetical protein
MRIAFTYIALAAAVAAFLSYVGPLSLYSTLHSQGVPVQGAVTRRDCENHNSFWYRFETSGGSIVGSGKDGAPKSCQALVPGDSVQVYYLPSDAKVNMSGNPAAALRNELTSIVAAAVILPAIAVWSYIRRRRKDDA